MNNYCRNCGEKIVNYDICEKCGTKVLEKRRGELDKLLEKKYIGIFFALFIFFIGSPHIIELFEFGMLALIFQNLFLVLIIFIIYAKKKLKYSKFFNILFWIMMILIIFAILLMLFIFLSFMYSF